MAHFGLLLAAASVGKIALVVVGLVVVAALGAWRIDHDRQKRRDRQ